MKIIKHVRYIKMDDDVYNDLRDSRFVIERGYVCFYKNSKRYRLHRYIMNPKGGEVVDHINRDTLDNRRENLRVCSKSQNRENSILYISNKSGYRGVYWNKRSGGWVATIRHNNKRYWIGTYKDKKDAALAYNNAAMKYHGSFASLNKV